MPEPLRVAVVGAGHMGTYHAQAVSERPDARLVAVCDIDPERAAALARAHGAVAVAAVEDLTGSVDAAVVAATTSAHEAVVRPLAEAGVAVLVEKPLAPTAEAARRLVETVRRTGVVAQAGHILRFDPVTRAIGRLGLRPRFVEVLWVAPFSLRSTDVGVVMDVMIHGLDVVLALAGGAMPHRIDAVGGVVVGPHEDFVSVRLAFPDGCVADLAASRMSRTRQRLVRVFAEGAYVKMDYVERRFAEGAYVKMDYVERRVERLRPRPDLVARLAEAASGTVRMEDLVAMETVPVPAEPDALRAQLDAFLRAVRGEGPVPVTVEEGLQAVELAERILAEVHGRRPEG